MWILNQLFQLLGLFALIACGIMLLWGALAVILMFWEFILGFILGAAIVRGLWYSLVE